MTVRRACRRVMALCGAPAALAAGGVLTAGCAGSPGARRYEPAGSELLTARLCEVVSRAPGTVGVALVTPDDTVTVNNGVRFAMMSVFKLHEALAVGDALRQRGASFDSVMRVSAAELDPHTWSPMLKERGEGDFDISVGELVRYALVSSDNNASNLLFSHVVSPAATDRFLKSVAADTAFAIRYSEAEMKREPELSYLNYSSPLAAACLIRQVFTTEILPAPSLEAVREALAVATTGADRLGAAVAGKEGVLFAHKTGSGYRNGRGELMAFNDVAYVRLPDGCDYSLAVMIRDFRGSEEEAAAVMAEVSRVVYDHMSR